MMFFFFFLLEHTFGFHRAEVIAALVSVLTIWVLTGFLVYEAIQRLRSPQVIDARLVTMPRFFFFFFLATNIFLLFKIRCVSRRLLVSWLILCKSK
jgi:Co/Zn/Cd efflux system component